VYSMDCNSFFAYMISFVPVCGFANQIKDPAEFQARLESHRGEAGKSFAAIGWIACPK
jgi:hypothetical protein